MNSAKLKQQGKAKFEQDPLEKLNQVDREVVLSRERKALILMANMLDNFEEIDELKEGLEDIVKYFPTYKDMPVGQMIEATAMPQIADVEAAIKAKDRATFTAAFDKLTTACNTCHQSANRPFIVIQRPASSVFPNQSFAPKR